MASNYRRRSNSSVSRRNSTSSYTATQRPRSRSRRETSPAYVSMRVGDIERAERMKQARRQRRKWTAKLLVIAIIIAALVGGGIALYLSPLFKVENITITGAEHLTETEMLALADIPDDTTLLRVDSAKIEENCLRDAWISGVKVNRIFPNTLELQVTERQIAATVEVPTGSSNITRLWAISADRIWLMPIPDKESEAASTVSQKIFDDADSVLKIVDVPYGTTPEIGATCTDSNINNALAIVSGMTTELADMVTRVSATDSESTILTLNNGVEIAFGTSDDIREKERVCLALLEEHEGSIAYINVRSVSSPTWRSL